MTTHLVYSDISSDTSSIGLDASEWTLRFVLTAISEGRFSEAVSRFNDRFTFIDPALDLEFTDKERLVEFFRKSREQFSDIALEIESSFAYGDHAAAEWKLTATQTQFIWNQYFRIPVVVRGSTIVRVDNGRVTRWSEYYDELTSRRYRLAGMFKEWNEY